MANFAVRMLYRRGAEPFFCQTDEDGGEAEIIPIDLMQVMLP